MIKKVRERELALQSDEMNRRMYTGIMMGRQQGLQEQGITLIRRMNKLLVKANSCDE